MNIKYGDFSSPANFMQREKLHIQNKIKYKFITLALTLSVYYSFYRK